MNVDLSASTRLIALLGDPVAHSLSPSFQNAAFRAAGVDGVYLALRCSADALPGLLRGIARAGGGGNVTVPHKTLAAETVERSTPAVQRTGACNTFWLEDGVVWGDNTDVAGVTQAVRSLLGRSPRGARVLLVGAGGAAHAALAALQDDGVGEVVVLNRTPERAHRMVERCGGEALARVAVDPARLAGERFDLAVNATSLGLHAADPHPLENGGGGPVVDAALDLVYSPTGTPWVSQLRSQGVPASDGLEMLLFQGAAAFERWWGAPAPLDAMRAALPGLASPMG